MRKVSPKTVHHRGRDVLGRSPGHVVPAHERLPIVTEWAGNDDYVNAPPDYEHFYRQYLSYTRAFIHTYGSFQVNDFDDVVSELMIRFMERDSIGVFSRDWSTRSVTGKSNFRSYYSRFLLTYLPGKKRNLSRVSFTELQIWDAPLDDGGATWADIHGPSVEFQIPDAEFQDLIRRIFDEVDESLYDAMFALLDLTIAKESLKAVSPHAFSARLGISRSRAEKLLPQLKATLARASGLVLSP